MRILVTGIHGQVGFELLSSLAPLGEVLPADRALIDLTQPDQIRAQLRALQPELIVHPAAYTAVDRAEQEPALAMAINAQAVGVLAEEAERLGAALIHYSTDYVFDGALDRPYRETDPTGPLGVYGHSKLLGEQLLAERCSQYLVLRTSWVYGTRGANFLLTMLRLSQERERLRVVDDQVGAPTWCRYIAERTSALVTRHVVREAERTVVRCGSGIVHLSAAGSTSWAGFAREIFRLAGRHTPVDDIPTSAYPTPARRPANSRLDTQKLNDLLGVPGEDWHEGLRRCLQGEGHSRES